MISQKEVEVYIDTQNAGQYLQTVQAGACIYGKMPVVKWTSDSERLTYRSTAVSVPFQSSSFMSTYPTVASLDLVLQILSFGWLLIILPLFVSSYNNVKDSRQCMSTPFTPFSNASQ